MVEGNVRASVEHLEQAAVASPVDRADVVEHVVGNENPLRLLARLKVIRPQDVHARGNVTDDVVPERHVFHDRPRCIPVLVSHREQNGETVLSGEPVILENVPLGEDTPGVLQLEDVLDGPRRASPRRQLEEVIAAHLDVRRHEVCDRRIRSAEENVLTGRRQVVVDDLERAGARPTRDRLRVSTGFVNLGDVRVDDRRRCAVERDAAAQIVAGQTVDVDAVQDQE